MKKHNTPGGPCCVPYGYITYTGCQCWYPSTITATFSSIYDDYLGVAVSGSVTVTLTYTGGGTWTFHDTGFTGYLGTGSYCGVAPANITIKWLCIGILTVTCWLRQLTNGAYCPGVDAPPNENPASGTRSQSCNTSAGCGGPGPFGGATGTLYLTSVQLLPLFGIAGAFGHCTVVLS